MALSAGFSDAYYMADGWEANTYETSAGGLFYLQESGHSVVLGSLRPVVNGETLTEIATVGMVRPSPSII